MRWACVYADLGPARGSEQAGRRPALIVSSDDANSLLPNVTVLPLTSVVRSLYPFEARLPRGAAGQPADSIVMAHQIRVVSKERVGRVLGRLEDAEICRRVEEAMKDYLDLR